jgi:hypothetical protein
LPITPPVGHGGQHRRYPTWRAVICCNPPNSTLEVSLPVKACPARAAAKEGKSTPVLAKPAPWWRRDPRTGWRSPGAARRRWSAGTADSPERPQKIQNRLVGVKPSRLPMPPASSRLVPVILKRRWPVPAWLSNHGRRAGHCLWDRHRNADARNAAQEIGAGRQRPIEKGLYRGQAPDEHEHRERSTAPGLELRAAGAAKAVGVFMWLAPRRLMVGDRDGCRR